jgi:hypothetical protein
MRVILADHVERGVLPRYMLHGATVDPAALMYTHGWRLYVDGWACPGNGDMQRGWLDAERAEQAGRDVRWSKR